MCLLLGIRGAIRGIALPRAESSIHKNRNVSQHLETISDEP
jgi:hypothetical protein